MTEAAYQVSTMERILDVAEVLFAERGFAETSLRTITSTAGVNLASVNYHFGSKKALIQSVFARYLTPFFDDLQSFLNTANTESVTLEDLLRQLLSSMVKGCRNNPQSLERLAKLLGLAYSQFQGHLKLFLIEEYGEQLKAYHELFKDVSPPMEPLDFYLKLYFMMGALVFTLSNHDAIESIMQADFQTDVNTDAILDQFVPVAIAMMNAKS